MKRKEAADLHIKLAMGFIVETRGAAELYIKLLTMRYIVETKGAADLLNN